LGFSVLGKDPKIIETFLLFSSKNVEPSGPIFSKATISCLVLAVDERARVKVGTMIGLGMKLTQAQLAGLPTDLLSK
jgi:hypothetical protein